MALLVTGNDPLVVAAVAKRPRTIRTLAQNAHGGRRLARGTRRDDGAGDYRPLARPIRHRTVWGIDDRLLLPSLRHHFFILVATCLVDMRLRPCLKQTAAPCRHRLSAATLYHTAGPADALLAQLMSHGPQDHLVWDALLLVHRAGTLVPSASGPGLLSVIPPAWPSPPPLGGHLLRRRRAHTTAMSPRSRRLLPTSPGCITDHRRCCWFFRHS